MSFVVLAEVVSAHKMLIKNSARAEEKPLHSAYEPIDILGLIFDVFVEL